MILCCDFCGKLYKEIIKIPCAFHLDQQESIFILPINEEAYRNICLACLRG